LFNYLADGLSALPLWDHRFDALDRAIGLDWPGLYDWVTARPRLYRASGLLYGGLNTEFLILLILLESLGKRRSAVALRLGFCISATATILIGVLMPALGPFVFYDLPVASQTAYVAQLAALRDGTLQQIDLSNAQGLIFFPSFHAALAVLCAHAARAVRGLFWPALLFNLLIICTAPVIGGHYFVDIVAGLVLSVAVILSIGGEKR
jgi:membrane-associated phospholipid phosphatase